MMPCGFRSCGNLSFINLFSKLVDRTQISTSPEATRHHNSTKLWILLPLRAIQFRPFQCDTPCTRVGRKVGNAILHQIFYSYYLRLVDRTVSRCAIQQRIQGMDFQEGYSKLGIGSHSVLVYDLYLFLFLRSLTIITGVS